MEDLKKISTNLGIDKKKLDINQFRQFIANFYFDNNPDCPLTSLNATFAFIRDKTDKKRMDLITKMNMISLIMI